MATVLEIVTGSMAVWLIMSILVRGLYQGHTVIRIKLRLRPVFRNLTDVVATGILIIFSPVSLPLLLIVIAIRAIVYRRWLFGWAWRVPCQYRVSPFHKDHERCDHCDSKVASAVV